MLKNISFSRTIKKMTLYFKSYLNFNILVDNLKNISRKLFNIDV